MSFHFVAPRLRCTNQTEQSSDADAQLVARCQAGERAAFEILLARYRNRVVNLAHGFLGSRDDAEDAAQDVFAAAFASIHTFRGDAQLWTWLYRITVNQCLHRKRRAKPCENRDDAGGDENPGTTRDESAVVVARLGVESALDELSPPLRAVLVLREMHDLTYEEIAAALQIPIGTVRSRLNQARREFKIAWTRSEES